MNFCNFAKVLLAHSSKDKASVDWWENENRTKDDSIPKVYINNLTMSARLENYRKFVKNLPKMQIETSHCQYSIPRIQEYFSHSKYWKNTNKSEERRKFLDFFLLEEVFFFATFRKTQTSAAKLYSLPIHMFERVNHAQFFI